MNNNPNRGGGNNSSNANASRGPPPGMEASNNNSGGGGGGRSNYRGSRGSGNGGGSNQSNGHSGKGGRDSFGSSASNTSTTNNAENNERNVLRERFLHLCLSMVGQTVTLTQTDGTILEGVFHTFAPFANQPKHIRNTYVVKACRVVVTKEETSSIENGSTVLIPVEKVSHVQVKSMRLDSVNVNQASAASSSAGEAAADMFRTDAEISGQKGGTQTLVAAGSAWTSAGDSRSSKAAASGGLDGGRGGMFKGAGGGGVGGGATGNSWRSSQTPLGGSKVGGLEGSIGNWDQFSANEEKFNVKATFDENLYTTQLDLSSMDSAKLAEAERIAKEIESTASSNIHIAEERNQAISQDYDEEDLYSGVLNKEGKPRAGDKTKVAKEVPKMNYAAAAGSKKLNEAMSSLTTSDNGNIDDTAAPTPAAEESKKSPDTATEEKKTESEEEKSGVEATDTPKEEVEAAPKGEEEKKKEESKLKLNPNAKAFTFNPTAKSFTPTFTAPVPVPPPQGETTPEFQQGGMPPMMGGPNMMPGGPQFMPQGGPGKSDEMISVLRSISLSRSCTHLQHVRSSLTSIGMMPHPLMRQQFPPYGQHPGAMPPPPQAPGQEDASSVATGEGSAEAGQLQQQQQQYGYGAIPPQGYPGYYGGGMMHPQARGGPGGFHPHMNPQMQVMPGGVPYQRMYAPQPMMRPPGPGYYPGGPGGMPYPGVGGGYPHNNEDDNGFRRKNSGRGNKNHKGGRGNYGVGGGKNNNYAGRGGRGGYQNHQDGRSSGDASPSNEVSAAGEEKAAVPAEATNAPVESQPVPEQPPAAQATTSAAEEATT